MDVRLSTEQQALRTAAAELGDRLGPDSVRALDDTGRRHKLVAALKASGWLELRTPDNGGAPWSSVVEPALVAEELGRALVDTAFLGPTIAAELRRLAGAPAAAGRETVAVTPDLTALAVADGQAHSGAVAVDAAESAMALTLVADGSSYRLGEMPTESSDDLGIDLTRPTARVSLDSVAPVAAAGFLTVADVLRATACGLALTCADLVGAMSGAIALACAHVTARRQYGVPVGSFQAVHHLLADAHVAMEGSRSVARHAAWAVDALEPAAALTAASVAKAYSARAARNVCETVIQVHGGIGNTWECLAHVFLRRALQSADLFGGVGTCLARVLDDKVAAAAAGK